MKQQPKDMNTTALAFLGDAVYEVYARKYVMDKGEIRADKLHRSAIKYVCADGQAKAVKSLMNDFLTEEEVKAFVEYQPIGSRELEIAHDLFVVQLYTGLSYSDLMRFDFSAYRMVDGAWIAVDARVKTGVPFVGHLLPPVVAVLDKYGGTLPRMCNQRYNRCLKVLGPAVGIRLTLHSHLARHTFATMMLRAGAKIENVSRMLGHTNITQTQHYAKVLAQSVHEDFELLARRLNN
jgi:integrase